MDPTMPPDLSAIQQQLAALQQSSQQRDEQDFLTRMQSGLSTPDSKYNYTETLGKDLLASLTDEGVDLKSASMEIVQAKLDEMDNSLQMLLSSLDEYRRSYKRDIDTSIRQVEDAVDELSRVKTAVDQVGQGAVENAATDSIPDPTAAGSEVPPDMGTAPPMDEGGLPPSSEPAGAVAPMDAGVPPMSESTPMDAGMGAAPSMDAGGPPPPPDMSALPVQPPPQYAKGGYVDNPKFAKIKARLDAKKQPQTVVSDITLKVYKPSKAVLAGVLGGI